jgi:hypothetical protein
VKHLFEDPWDVVSVGYTGCEHIIENFVHEQHYPPGDFTTEPDVAVIVPKDHSRAVLDSVAVDWSSVTTNGDDVFEPTKRFAVLTGYPWAYVSHRVNHATKTGVQTLGSVASQAMVTGRDRDRFVLDWNEVTVQQVNADHPAARGSAADVVARASVGDTVKLPPPNGMSGGALWAFEPVSGGFWYPSLTGRLIGIQSSWNKDRTLFVESPRRYGAWLVKTLRQVDRTLGRRTPKSRNKPGPKAQTTPDQRWFEAQIRMHGTAAQHFRKEGNAAAAEREERMAAELRADVPKRWIAGRPREIFKQRARGVVHAQTYSPRETRALALSIALGTLQQLREVRAAGQDFTAEAARASAWCGDCAETWGKPRSRRRIQTLMKAVDEAITEGMVPERVHRSRQGKQHQWEILMAELATGVSLDAILNQLGYGVGNQSRT